LNAQMGSIYDSWLMDCGYSRLIYLMYWRWACKGDY
jgi:hypothetical protein